VHDLLPSPACGGGSARQRQGGGACSARQPSAQGLTQTSPKPSHKARRVALAGGRRRPRASSTPAPTASSPQGACPSCARARLGGPWRARIGPRRRKPARRPRRAASRAWAWGGPPRRPGARAPNGRVGSGGWRASRSRAARRGTGARVAPHSETPSFQSGIARCSSPACSSAKSPRLSAASGLRPPRSSRRGPSVRPSASRARPGSPRYNQRLNPGHSVKIKNSAGAVPTNHHPIPSSGSQRRRHSIQPAPKTAAAAKPIPTQPSRWESSPRRTPKRVGACLRGKSACCNSKNHTPGTKNTSCPRSLASTKAAELTICRRMAHHAAAAKSPASPPKAARPQGTPRSSLGASSGARKGQRRQRSQGGEDEARLLAHQRQQQEGRGPSGARRAQARVRQQPPRQRAKEQAHRLREAVDPDHRLDRGGVDAQGHARRRGQGQPQRAAKQRPQRQHRPDVQQRRPQVKHRRVGAEELVLQRQVRQRQGPPRPARRLLGPHELHRVVREGPPHGVGRADARPPRRSRCRRPRRTPTPTRGAKFSRSHATKNAECCHAGRAWSRA
jgi:hypothetical protein